MEDHCLAEASSTVAPTNPLRSNSDSLLEEVFPKHVAEALKAGRKVEPQHYECVTIFFSGAMDMMIQLPTISYVYTWRL
jgi:hypothetical protein